MGDCIAMSVTPKSGPRYQPTFKSCFSELSRHSHSFIQVGRMFIEVVEDIRVKVYPLTFFHRKYKA